MRRLTSIRNSVNTHFFHFLLSSSLFEAPIILVEPNDMTLLPKMLRTIISRTSRNTCKVNSLSILSKLSANPILHSSANPYLCTNIRYHSTSNNASKSQQIKLQDQRMMIAFTCKKCNTRSAHDISKQAYTKGTILITCPGCKNRHLIADHLKIFSDSRITVQDILKEKGESISQNPDDLVFEEIPDKLKGLIGHLAKDSPKRNNEEQDRVHALPHDEIKKTS